MLFQNIIKGDLSRLVNVVCNKQTATKLTGIFKRLHDDAGIGFKSQRNMLELTEEHRKEIQRIFYAETDYRLLRGHPDTRLEASIIKNCSEKISKFSPKERVIEIRSFNNVVTINGMSYSIPPKSSISISTVEINTIEHENVLVIENYEAFINAGLLRLIASTNLQNALLVYRGDREGGHVKEFIDQVNKPIYGWFDSDPHGLNLALATKNITGILMPTNDVALYKKAGIGKVYDDQKQFVDGVKVKVLAHEYLRRTVAIYEKTGKCLMQEAILARQLPLALIQVKT